MTGVQTCALPIFFRIQIGQKACDPAVSDTGFIFSGKRFEGGCYLHPPFPESVLPMSLNLKYLHDPVPVRRWSEQKNRVEVDFGDVGFLIQVEIFKPGVDLLHLLEVFTDFTVEYQRGMDGGKDSDRKSTRLNSSHIPLSRMPSSA